MPQGVTLAGLKALCAKFGLLSPGRAAAMLLYLRYLGYVSPWRDRSASGRAIYQTSPAFLAAWRAHYRAVLDAAALIDPGAGRVAARLDDPAFFQRFCQLHLEALVEGVKGSGTNADTKVKFLRRIPLDPFTKTREWGLRSMQDDPKSNGWGGQNVFDVYSKSDQKAADGTPYAEW